MMKKIVGVLFVLSLFFALAPTAFAANEDEPSTAINSADVPEEIAKYIPEEIFDASSEDFLEVFTVSGVLKTIISIIGTVFPEAMSAFLLLLGLCVIAAVLRALKESVSSAAVGYMLEFISVLCMATAAFSFAETLFDDFKSFVEQVSSFMVAIIPAMSALMLTGGEITSSTVFGGVLAAVVTFLESLCSTALLPLMSALLCISVTSKVCGEVDISGFSKLIKTVVTYILSAVMLILTCVMTFQSVIAKSADTAAVKGVKFVLGNAIPIVGGALSDAVSTVASSVGMVKSATGIAGAIVLCVIFAVPVLKLIIWKIMFDGVSAVSSAFSLKKESVFFAEIAEITGFLIAIMASIAVFFIIALTAASFAGGGAVK